MRNTWNTKYGTRRVRLDLPTLEEAIAAARGLTDNLEAQVEVASSLIGLPPDQVRPEVLKAAGQRQELKTVTFTNSRAGAPRAVIVELKPSRRIPARIPAKTLVGR